MRRPAISMDALVGFVALAETRNWTHTAKQLGITESALRKRMKYLADALKAQLVQTMDNQLQLTEAGELFYRDAARSVEHALLAEEKTRAYLLLRANHLLVGHSTFLAPKLLAVIRQLAFEREHAVHIEHRTGLTRDMVDRVLKGTLHAGFGYLPVLSKGLLVRQLLEEPLVACIPNDFPAAVRTEIRPQDLDGQRLVAFARDHTPSMHSEIEEYYLSFGIELKIAADAFSAEEALTYVEQRVGICLLSRSSAKPHRGVTVRPLATRALTRRSGLFLREDNRDALIAEFMEMVLRHTAKFSRLSS